MDNDKRFRTKTGYCHILSDRIVLTRDGAIGNLSNIVVGNTISRILIIYSIISLILFYLAYESFSNDKILQAGFFVVIGVFLILGIVRSFNNSATPIILRDSIEDIRFKKGVPGATRSRFEVYYKEENGKIKKRLIMLPGSMSDGQDETEKALKIMIEEELINNR